MSASITTDPTTDLTDFLAFHGVDTAAFGVGTAKSLAQLAGEIAAGESVLSLDEDGRVVRDAAGACVNVYHRTADGRLLRLVEDRQELANGLVRRRDLNSSIGEKLMRGERPLAGARRALREELGLDVDPPLRADYLMLRVTDSFSYPGLRSRYAITYFRCTLDDDAYRPEGYVEVQPDKHNFFCWTTVDDT